MPENTPTTEQVREAYQDEMATLPSGSGPGRTYNEAGSEFDRWLAARDRENRAIGWDEGAETATQFHEGPKGHWEDRPRRLRTWIPEPAPANPYRGDSDGRR